MQHIEEGQERKEKQEEKCGRHWSSSVRPTPVVFVFLEIGVVKFSDSVVWSGDWEELGDCLVDHLVVASS